MTNKKSFFVAVLIALCCIMTGCIAQYFPIAKIEKYYAPTVTAKIISSVSPDMIYIGKLKMVPSDNSFSFDKEKAIAALLKEAANNGANYVYIKGLNSTSSDYEAISWDQTFGDGVTIEAELYR